MSRKNQHVVPCGRDWAVRGEGNNRKTAIVVKGSNKQKLSGRTMEIPVLCILAQIQPRKLKSLRSLIFGSYKFRSGQHFPCLYRLQLSKPATPPIKKRLLPAEQPYSISLIN